ncbi:hypothetical protein BCA37_24485 [Mycobacterium sp. djl-10]|nr:hypothetical protein BCA37_24485 [Mycobacterium sp. djl-10]
MSIDIPPALQWISYLAGSKWPQGDEDGLWRIGELWKASAEEMSDLIPDLTRVRQATMSVITGETAAIAEQEFAKLFDGDYSVDKLVEAMKALGETAREAGTQVEASKIEILVGLAMAAAEILYAMAMAPWTFGGSLAWIPAIEALTIVAIRALFSQLIRALVRRAVEALTKTAVLRLLRNVATQSAQEIAEEVIINLSIQGYQVGQGHKDEIDGGDVATAAKGAAAGGAAAGAVHGPAFGAFGGKHGGSGMGNAAAGAGASYTAEVVAGVVGAVAVGGTLDAGEIFAGGALGAVSGGIESSHSGKNNSADDAPVGPDAGKSHAFDSEGKGPDGQGPGGDTDSSDVPPPYAKDDPGGSPPRYEQLNSDGPQNPSTAVSHNPGVAPTDTPQTRDSSSAPQAGDGREQADSQRSGNGDDGVQSNPQPLTGDDRSEDAAAQPESGSSQSRDSGSASSASSGRAGQDGHQTSSQETATGHTSDQPAPQQASGQSGSTAHTSEQAASQQASGKNGSDTAGSDSGGTGDSTATRQEPHSNQSPESRSEQPLAAASASPIGSNDAVAQPESSSVIGTVAQPSNPDQGSPIQEGSRSNPTPNPSGDVPAVQSDSPQVGTSDDGASPRAESTSPDTTGSKVEPTPPTVQTPPPAAASTPPATSPSTMSTPTAAPPAPATPSSAPASPAASSTPTTSTPLSSPAGSSATPASNPAGSANPANPVAQPKSMLGGSGASLNSVPTAVSSVASSTASSSAARSAEEDQPQVVVGLVAANTPQAAATPPQPAPRRPSSPPRRDTNTDVADDEAWRHNPAATADWFDPVGPTPREQIDAHRDDTFVQTMDTEVANVLTSSTPTHMPTPHTTLIRYDLRRIEVAPNKFVQEYTVKLSLSAEADSDVGDDTLAELKSRAEAGVERLLNRGHRLPSGDEFRVRVEFTDTDAHVAVTVGSFAETTQTRWRPDAGDNVLAHEILHYLGVPDEGRDPRIALRQHSRNAGVHDGDGGMMASDLLGTDPRLRPRHLWTVERTANSQLPVPPRWLTSADNARIPLTPRHFDPDDQPLETSRAPKPEGTEDTEDTSGESHVQDADGNLHWGRYGAAGLLLRAWGHDGAPRVLLQRRAQWSDQGGTWGLPGGARNRDETAEQAALRETEEEAGISGDRITVRSKTVTATAPGIDWTYSTVVADAPYPLRATSNGEGTLRWVRIDEVADLHLHPGLAASWDDVRAQMDDNPMPAPRPSPQIDHTIDPTDVSGVYAIGNPEGAIYFRDDNGLLYREDSRPPEVIFEEGFAIREDYRHNSKVTHFISATRDPHLGYLRNKTPEGPVYRYTIDAPGGVDVNRTVGIRSSDYQTEISFPGGIRRENIVSAVEVFAPESPTSEGEGPSRLRYGPVVVNTQYFNPDLPNAGAPALLMGPVGGRDDLSASESESESTISSLQFRRGDGQDTDERDTGGRDTWDLYMEALEGNTRPLEVPVRDPATDDATLVDHGVQNGRLYLPFAKRAKVVNAAHTQWIGQFVDHVVAEAVQRHSAGRSGVTVHVQGGGNGGKISAGADVVGQQRAQAVLAQIRPRIEERLQGRNLPPGLVVYANPTSRGKTVPEHIPGTDRHIRRRMVVAHIEDQPAPTRNASRGVGSEEFRGAFTAPSQARGDEFDSSAEDFEPDSDTDVAAHRDQGELVPAAEQDAAYRTVAPALADHVERDPIPATGLPFDERYLYLYLRDADDALPQRAVEHYAAMVTSDFQGRMWRLEQFAGVSVDGIDDSTLGELIRANPRHLADFPELQTYLAGADDAVQVDVSLTRRGAAVEFHHSPDDPTAAPRQRLVMDALNGLEQGGYDLPGTTLEVHLPPYHRAVRVRPVMGTDRRPADLDITATPLMSREDGYVAEFVAPNQLVVTSLATAPPPEASVRTGVADELEHRGLAIVLHELMHQLHWQQNPALLADLVNTSVREIHQGPVGAVSRYALRSPSEFVAEAGLGALLGWSSGDPELDDQIEALYRTFGGPLRQRPGGEMAPPELTADELSDLTDAIHQRTGRELSGDEVRNAQAQLAPFDQWRTVADRARLIADHIGIRSEVHPREQPPLVTASTSQDPVDTPPAAPAEPTGRVFDDDEVAVLRGWQDWAAGDVTDSALGADVATSSGPIPESQQVPPLPSHLDSVDSMYAPDSLSSRDSVASLDVPPLPSHQDSKESQHDLDSVQVLPVNPDGWCLLYAVLAGLNPRDWPMELRGHFADHDSAHAAVLQQLERTGQRPEVPESSPLAQAARALHRLVTQTVHRTPPGRWGDDVLLPFRRSQERMTALGDEVGSLSREVLRQRLRGLGVAAVTPSDSLSPDVLRDAYVQRRTVELQVNEGLPESEALIRAESEVAAEVNATGDVVFTADALGMQGLAADLQRRGVTIGVDDLSADDLRAVLVDQLTHQPMTASEHAGLLQALARWRPRTVGWNTDFGEMFLPLVAHTLGVRIRNLRNPDAQDVGPTDTGRTVDVYYNGTSHYDAARRVPAGTANAVTPESAPEAKPEPENKPKPEPESKPEPKPESPPSPPPPPTRRSAPGDEFDVAAYVRRELASYDRAHAGLDVEQGGRATAKNKGRWRAAMEATSVYQDLAPHDDAELLDFLGELTFPGTTRPVLEFLSHRLSELAAQMDPRDAEASAADLDSAEGDVHRPVYETMRTSVAPVLRGAARSADVLARRPVNIWPPSLKKAGVTLGMTALTGIPWVYPSVREERAYIASLVAGFSKVIPRDIGMLLYPHANARLLLNYARDSTFPWQSEDLWALTLLSKKWEENRGFGWFMLGFAVLWYLGLGYGPSIAKRWDSLPRSSGRAVRTGVTPLPSRDEVGDEAPLAREDLVEPARHIDRAVAVLREAVRQFLAEDRGQAISENLRTQIQFVEDDVRWARQWVGGLQGIAPASQPNPDLIGKLAFLVPHLLVHGIATSAGALSDPLSFASSAADGAYVMSRAFAVAFDPNRSVDDAREVFTNLTAEGLPGLPVDLAVIITTALGREDAVWGNPRVYPGLLAFYGLASMTYAAWLGEMIAYGVAWPITKLFGAGGHAADSTGVAVEAVDSPIEMSQLAASNNLVWDESRWEAVRDDPQFDTRLQAVLRWLSPGGGELTEQNYRLDANRDKPAALAALHALHIWHVSGEAAAEKFATSDDVGRQLDDAPKERRVTPSSGKKTADKATAESKGRIPVPGDGWCLLSAVVLSTPPEQWPATWVPESSTAAQSYSAALDQARGTHVSSEGQRHLEHARTALYAQVHQFVLARGGYELPDRAVTLFRGNHAERTQLERWLALAEEHELRNRLSDLGFDENSLVESEEWLSVDSVRERYVAARIQHLTPDAGHEEARRIVHRAAGIEAGGRINADPPVGRRGQYEWLRDHSRLPLIRDLRAGEELREAVRFASSQRLTDMEYAGLLAAVESWQEWGWTSSYGDMFSTLVAHTLDVQVHDVVNHSTVGPESATRTVNVRYNGRNHYEGNLPPLARHREDGRIDGPMHQHIARAVDEVLPARAVGSVIGRWSAASVRQTTIYRDVAHRDDPAFVRLVREELTDPETGELALASLMDDLDDLHALVAAHPRHALSDSQQRAYRVLRSSASAILDRAMGSVQGLLRTESTLHRLRQSIPAVLATPLPYFAPILQNPQSLNFLNLIAGTHLKAALTIGGMASHATYSKRLMGKATFDLLLPLNVPGLVTLTPVMRPSLLKSELTPGRWGWIAGGVQAGVFVAVGFADYIPRLINSALSLAIGAGVPLPETDYHALRRGRLRILSESGTPRVTDVGALESQPAPLTQEALIHRISRIRSRYAMLVAAQHAFEERGAHVSETTEHQISLIGKDILELERLAARLVDAPEAQTLGNVDFWPKFGYAGVTAVIRGGGMAASILSRDPLAMATVVPASGFLIARTIIELLDPTATASDAAASFMHFTPPALVAILPNVVNYFNGGRTFRTVENSYPWLLYTLAATALLGDPLADLLARAVSGRLRTSRATPTPDPPAVEHAAGDDGDSPEDMGAAGVPGGFSPAAHHRAPSPSSIDAARDRTPLQEEPKSPPAGDLTPSDVEEAAEGWGAPGVPGGFSFGSPDPYAPPLRTSLPPIELSAFTERPAVPEDRAATETDASQNVHPSDETARPPMPPWRRNRREDSLAGFDTWSSDHPLPPFARPSRLGWTPWSVPNPTARRVDDHDGSRPLPKWTDFVPAEYERAGPSSAPRLPFGIPSDSESFESSVAKAKSVDSADDDSIRGDEFGGPQTSLESVPAHRMHTVGHPDTAHSLITPEAALDLAQQALLRRAELADAARTQADGDDANLIRNPLGDAERSVATARRNAQWWQGLSVDQRRAMATVYPEQVGNAEGLPAQVRDEANRRILADTIAREESNSSRRPKWIARLDAVRKALRHADNRLSTDRGGRPLVLAFDPEAFARDGRILVAVGGDPYRAPSVSWIVPGITTTMGSLGSVLSDAINLMGSARAEGAPDPVVIAWIGYQPPSGWRLGRTARRNAAQAGGEIVHADIRAFNAGRDANTIDGSRFSNNHVFAHSYGSTTTSFAGREGRLAGQVRTVTLLGSPGAGPLQTAADFGIGDNVFVASSSRDPVTGFGRMPAPLVPFGQGTDPALRSFGARRLASEFPRAMDEFSTVFTHVSYYRHVDAMGSRTQSLVNFGRIVADRQDQVELHSHRRAGGPLLRVIPRTYEPAIDPSADRRWWGVNWTGPKTAGDEDSIAAESDSSEPQEDPTTPSEVRFGETVKTLDEQARRAVQARATAIAREVAQRYDTDRDAPRLVVHVDVGANGRRWPFASWPYNGRPEAVGRQRAAGVRRLLEEEVHAQLDRLEVPRSKVTFREESRARGLPDSSGRPHDFGSDETARRLVQIRTEAEAPVSDREVHVDFAERSTRLGIIQRDQLLPFLDHIADEAAHRSVTGAGAMLVQVDGGGNGGNLLHSADTVGAERARAVRDFLQAGLRARLGGRGIHTSMVRFVEATSRGNALPGGAPATGNRPTDAQATRRVTVRLEEVPATHHAVDSPPSPRPEDPPPTLPPLPMLPPLPTFGDNDSVHEDSRSHETRASSPRGRSSLGRNLVDGGSFLAARHSPDTDESSLNFDADSDSE